MDPGAWQLEIDDDMNTIPADAAVRIYELLDVEVKKAEKPAANISKPVANNSKPVKKVTAGSEKRKPLDDGKMLALRRAGWTYKKIADEMGCAEQTVINHIQDKEGKA